MKKNCYTKQSDEIVEAHTLNDREVRKIQQCKIIYLCFRRTYMYCRDAEV